MSTNTALDDIKARAEKFANLCPDYMAQGIRHLERNCDLTCHAEMQDPGHDCKRPDRYDGEEMAEVLAAAPKLLAALEAVEAQAERFAVADSDLYGDDFNKGHCAGYRTAARLTRQAIEEALR